MRYMLVAMVGLATPLAAQVGHPADRNQEPRFRIESGTRELLRVHLLEPAALYVFRYAPDRELTLLWPGDASAEILPAGPQSFGFESRPGDLEGVPEPPPPPGWVVPRERPCLTPQSREVVGPNGGRYVETSYECSSAVTLAGSHVSAAASLPSNQVRLLVIATTAPASRERLAQVVATFRPKGNADRTSLDLLRALSGRDYSRSWKRMVVAVR